MPFVTPVTNLGTGVSISPVVAEFKNDAINSSVFTAYTPTSTFSVALTNQQFTGLNYGTANYQGSGFSTLQTTGLVFGLQPTVATDPLPQGGFPTERYNRLGTYAGGLGGPTVAMFTSNPKAVGASQLGTGILPILGSNAQQNGGVEIFTTAQALYYDTITYPRGSRVYFGDLVLKFSQPVLNPVIHLAGLGGSYRFVIPGGNPLIASDYRSTFFTTELELVNAGLTSTLLSGNAYMALSGNNIVNSNHTNPNGGSINDPSETPLNNLGAATGSIKLTGTVQTITYRVYLQGGSASQFAWSYSGAILGAPRDPLTGDIWYVAASYDKPVKQISGNVFIDKDGLTDNNINQSGGLPNAKTNVGNSLYANLISGGLVVATVPISGDGTFLFDVVSNGAYTVQLSTNQGVVGIAPPVTVLPAGWANTGEFIGSGAGNDGIPANGLSATINISGSALGSVQTEVNFGIERLPDSKPFTTIINSPQLNDIITLNSPLLPILTGSDPEDQPIENVLTGKTVKITVLPTNSTLRYNGINVTANQVIPNFNPALLTILFNIATTTSATQFQYAYVDAAGLPDPSPAIYQLLWSGGPLIITLTEFNAVKNNCIANLSWKTSSEINGDRFEVELSTNNGADYTKVGTVTAIGNSSSTQSYQFSYSMQSGVTHYFRLKSIDKDGSFKYSDIRSLSCINGKGGIVVAPNPVRDMFSIKGMENGKNSISIFATNGQLVHTQIISQNQGDVHISNLASGLYMVKVTSENGNTVISKLIKN